MRKIANQSLLGFYLAVVISLFALPANSAHAQILAVNFNNPTVINSFSAGTLDGYTLFGTSTSVNGTISDIISNPIYASVSAGSGTSAASYYYSSQQLTVAGANGGSPFYTGTVYNSGSPVTLATINLTGTVPSTFTVGILTGNSDYAPNNAVITLTAYTSGGTQIGSSVALNDFTAPSLGNTYTNDFYFATISGLSSGDYITASGNQQYSFETSQLGGVVFEAAAVPEPSTYAILGFGLGILAFAARRRFALLASIS